MSGGAVERAAEAIRASVIDTPTEKAALIMARAGLDAALDVEEMARVLTSATWPDGSADGFPSKRVAEMLATALRAAILGGAA